MKSVKDDLPKSTTSATWVKGHQDDTVPYDDPPFEARENIDMDKKCERVRSSEEPVPPIPYFSSENSLARKRR
jgi:hypothetical protein